ncbi:hypothetical protein FB384_004889 [Prauserella sediminis]|uniref:Uncharacterized protein n=1 Tax=Prauserella sediminis TaxID=577680 RepID=A0A839XRW6_9PSEU|nr:hypothetical protein [Prauserella sediminis]MBB3665930.1 hypothetical protein [Prauserella sediminis]
MSTRFSRAVPRTDVTADPSLLEEVRADVRAHLSVITTEDDDEETNAAEVDTWVEERGDELLVHGSIDRDPVAVYLRTDFDPEQEAAGNPLSVPSDHGEHSIAATPEEAER